VWTIVWYVGVVRWCGITHKATTQNDVHVVLEKHNHELLRGT